MSKLFLIRHGQASFMSANYDQLSDLGYEQARALGRFFVKQEVVFTQAYAGPLARQQQTYDMVAEIYKESGLPFPEMQMKPELAEYRGMATMADLIDQIREKHPQFGIWHDQMIAKPDPKIKMKMTLAYLRLWAKDELGIPLPDWFQSWQSFNGVVQKGFGEILEANQEKQTAAVFSSGGTISCILGKVLDLQDPDKVMGLNTVMQNSAVSQVLQGTDRLSLFSFNDLRHLPEDLVTAM